MKGSQSRRGRGREEWPFGYIDTLKDNPFVNDLMHQKNIDDVETNFIY